MVIVHNQIFFCKSNTLILDSEEENKLTIDIEEKMLRDKRKKEKKQRKREKRLRQLEQMRNARSNICNQQKQQILVLEASEDTVETDHGADANMSEDQYYQISPKQPSTANTQEKSKDIRTVDLSQLGDLFSVPTAESKNQTITVQAPGRYFL